MFWDDEELKQLKGTEVLPRIGKEKSEEQYIQDLLPLIISNQQIFDPQKCGIAEFHRMGSLVLAYSFGRNSSNDENDDEHEESSKNEIAMVPLADMLNANPQLNNVCLQTILSFADEIGTIVPSWNWLGNEIYPINPKGQPDL
jgi:N-lysine methyltransferase SETD6